MAAFELSFRIQNFKEKVSGEITFALISLFHVQMQEPKAGRLPQEHLSFLQNLLNFIITKYLKQEVDDDLSVCMDERSACGISVTKDTKIYQCHMIKR